MSNQNLVTVILPAYNAEPYLVEAIDSILNQTYTNFELIVINDCSTDNTLAVAQQYTDSRVKVISNPKNLRLIETLNYGFSLVTTKYIARMDGDDISDPTRLQKQVDYMEQHPDVGIMSCGFRNFVAQEGDVFYSETNEDIKLNLLYKTQICHAAALIRTDLVAQHTPFYNNDYQHAEDYELWARMAQYTNYYNLQEVLYHVRVLKTSVSRVFADVQHNNTLRVIKYLFSRFGISITDAELDLWLKFCYADFVFTPAELKALEGILVGLVNANPTINYVNQSALEQFLAFKWFNLCYNNVKNKEVQKIFNSSKISALAPLPNRLKFKAKAVLG